MRPPAAAPANDSRIGVLDAFRALAILSVLLFHFTYHWGPLEVGGRDLTGFAVNVPWFSHGWLGVEFFFIISGFVIFMTVEKSRGVIDFAISRFARIYPTFVFCMTVSFLLELAIAPAELKGTLAQFLAGLTMQSSHFRIGWIDGAYWSLLVELKFYVWIALLYFGLRRWFVPAWVLFCLGGIGMSFVSYSISELLMIAQYTPFFSIGMAYYLRYRNGRLTNESVALYTIGALSYAVYWLFRDFEIEFVATNSAVLIMLLLFEGFLRGLLPALANPLLIGIGLISYPLYLLHQHIGVSLVVLFNRMSTLNGVPSIVLAAATIFTLTLLVHAYIENPSRRFVRAALHRFTAAPTTSH